MKNLTELQSNFKFRENVWDTELFGINTFEILDFNSENENVTSFLNELSKDNSLILCRADANDLNSKKLLCRNGFQVMETSHDIFLALTSRYEIPKIYRSKSLALTEASIEDQLQIKEFIGKTFKYSRFHEDPLINPKLADIRMQNRVDVFIETKSHKCLVHKTTQGEVVSFIYYSELDDSIYFELGGSKLGKGHYTPFFWSSLISHFKSLNFKKIRTRISSANTGVANIYWSFGFKISSTVLDYHKHILTGENT